MWKNLNRFLVQWHFVQNVSQIFMWFALHCIRTSKKKIKMVLVKWGRCNIWTTTKSTFFYGYIGDWSNTMWNCQLFWQPMPVIKVRALFHKYSDSKLKPIAFASRTFKDGERNYSTIDKEALAIVFGVQKFHQYLYSRPFTLLCDHKPLERIFG